MVENSGSNPDGWGLGFYTSNVGNLGNNRVSIVIKEANECRALGIAKKLLEMNQICSNIIIGHIRRGNTGQEKDALLWTNSEGIYNKNLRRFDTFNTHPFNRVLFGAEWIFAHNGTVYLDENRETYPLVEHFYPVGGTDSEMRFATSCRNCSGTHGTCCTGARLYRGTGGKAGRDLRSDRTPRWKEWRKGKGKLLAFQFGPAPRVYQYWRIVVGNQAAVRAQHGIERSYRRHHAL